MVLVHGQSGFGDDAESVELWIGLGDEIDPRVMGVETGADHLAAFDEFAVPAVLAEGFFHREDLS